MIEIFLLEQLITFAQCGTLSKAAKELHITQPALSRSMKKLENEFGVSLFTREKSKIMLNETGKIATEYAKKVLDANREMIEKTILIQDSLDVLHELIKSSSLPVFHSDRAVEQGYTAEDRIALPLSDKAAHVTYYLACMDSAIDITCLII